MVSPRSTAMAVRRTLDAGAAALVFEPELFRALVPALRAVESGQSVVPRNLRAGVERPYLSHRERQVLTLVCEGLTNAEIAGRLILAESTIKSHMSSIFVKFGVHSRKEAVAAFTDLTQATLEALTVDGPALPPPRRSPSRGSGTSRRELGQIDENRVSGELGDSDALSLGGDDEGRLGALVYSNLQLGSVRDEKIRDRGRGTITGDPADVIVERGADREGQISADPAFQARSCERS